MIEKILDNYFTKKLLDRTKDIMMNYWLDYKFEKQGNAVFIKIKHKRFKNSLYCTIGAFLKDKSINKLCNFKEYEDYIKKGIKWYQNKIKED